MQKEGLECTNSENKFGEYITLDCKLLSGDLLGLKGENFQSVPMRIFVGGCRNVNILRIILYIQEVLTHFI